MPSKEIKLKVGELTSREEYGRGIARLDSRVMRELGIKEGDVIEIEGKRKSAAIAVRPYPSDVGLAVIRIDGLVRKNAGGVSVGEFIKVRKCEYKDAKKVTLAPAQKGIILHMSPNILRNNLFMRPLIKGDIIVPTSIVSRRGESFFESFFGPEFDILTPFGSFGAETKLAVVKTVPEGPVRVTEETEIELKPQAVDIEEVRVPTVTYEDIGGLHEEIKKVREMIELPLKHPELFERLGVEPPKGILMHGPPGTGKTLLAKAVASEAGAHFLSINGPEIVSKWYGQSLPADEELLVIENGVEKRMPIGEIVENKRTDLSIVSFDKSGKTVTLPIADVIKHPLKGKLFEVKTKTGRRIKVTDFHSLFTLNGTKIEDIRTDQLKPGESYIAIPKRLPSPAAPTTSINLLEALRTDDHGIRIRKPATWIKKAVEKIGRKKSAELLGVSDKYLYDIYGKNVGVGVSKFLKLMYTAGIAVDPSDVRIGTKRSEMPALLEMTPELGLFLGLWTAEGSYFQSGGVRLSLHESELAYVKDMCEKLFGRASVYKKPGTKGGDVIVSSATLGRVMKNVLDMDGGSRNKRIPVSVMAAPEETVLAFLRGYFSGDGAAFANQHGAVQVEAITASNRLADDMLYALLRFGIVAKVYPREWADSQRIVISGANDLEKFVKIGFVRNDLNEKVQNCIDQSSWRRSNQIPLGGSLAQRVSMVPSLHSWSNSASIGLAILGEYAEDMGEDVEALIDNDIYWDLVEEVRELPSEKYVYDISVEPTQNFVAGFGGVFAHNSEQNLRKIFKEAEDNAPAIIFIDEIDAIAPKREEVTGEVERRMVSQLLTLMDGLEARGKVIVIAATNRVNAIDQALRRPGRFDREIEMGVPDKRGRKEVLQIHTRNMPLDKDVDLDKISEVTYGFVGADLAALCKEAAMHVLRRVLPDVQGLEEGKPIPEEILKKLIVTKKDYDFALKMIQPSAMREIMIEIPKIKWAEIGGLDDVKRRLKETVEMPLKNPEAFKRMGIKPPRGILLYGPPGCGKTLMAKAVATESDANFISIKGPQVLSKWVGESEKMIREIFKKARQVAPCVVFFDEIDSLAPARTGGSESHVSERVVSQMLTEMSGLEDLKDVVVLAATNRPDIIDPALLRPGRFDMQVLVTPPSAEARLRILEIHTKNMPIEGVNLKTLSEKLEGYSGADIEALCREAALNALRENISAKKVTSKHFTAAFKDVKPSLSKEIVDYFSKFDMQKKAADIMEREATRYVG